MVSGLNKLTLFYDTVFILCSSIDMEVFAFDELNIFEVIPVQGTLFHFDWI